MRHPKNGCVQIVSTHGTMWARNQKNINEIPHDAEGLYILFDGSMPVYVAKGNIHDRVVRAAQSKRRGEMWDRFSWFALRDPKMTHDAEVLLLKMLPRYFRALTRQEGDFVNASREDEEAAREVDYITRKPQRRSRKR